jgi:folate-binding protein YgfZ
MVEKDLPQETSQTRALHVNKGCYLGQEIVERIHARGNVHRHLRPLELTGAVPENGTEIKLENGTSVGHITSAAEVDLPQGKRIFALGVVKSETESGNQILSYAVNSANGTARILEGPPKL